MMMNKVINNKMKAKNKINKKIKIKVIDFKLDYICDI